MQFKSDQNSSESETETWLKKTANQDTYQSTRSVPYTIDTTIVKTINVVFILVIPKTTHIFLWHV